MKKFPFYSVFSSRIKSVVSEEKDKYLALASTQELQKFVPKINSDKNYDLLPISFSACVVNRVNKNKDAINTATALKIYDTFVNKYINIEHDRNKIIGCIVSAGFSEFGTEKPLTREEVEGMTSPFNITLGGVIWRQVNSDISDLIEDSADPSSDKYLSVSASWELGYQDYIIAALPADSKNIEDGRLISDATEIEKIKEHLTAFGGKGKLGEEYLYRLPSDGVIAIGIGLTENPAADVKGVATTPEEEEEVEEEDDVEEVEGSTKNPDLEQNIKNTISQPEIIHVNENRKDMKIHSLKDITDENLKIVSAASICDFVKEEIDKINTQYLEQKQAKEGLEKNHAEALAKSTQDLEATKAQLESVQKELNEIKSLIEAKKREEIFSSRMAQFDEEFELDDEDRSVLASQIKDLDETSFAAFQKSAKTLLKNRKKGEKKVEEKGETKPDNEMKETKASASATEEQKSSVDTALSNAEVKTASIPATPSSEVSLKEKWANAFKEENIIVTTTRKR